jgi:hypothetical protein
VWPCFSSLLEREKTDRFRRGTADLGFASHAIAGLVNHGLVAIAHEMVPAGGKTVDVGKVRITETGPSALKS